MGNWRWLAVALVAVVACTRPNPAFDAESGEEGTSANPDPTTTGSLDPSSSIGSASADATAMPMETSIDATTVSQESGSGETMDTADTVSSTESDTPVIHLYKGPEVKGGFAMIAPGGPDPAKPLCLNVNEFAGLCSNNEQVASLVRFEGGMLDELVARGVPLDRPINSPMDELVAADLETLIARGPLQPLQDTPSIFAGEPSPFWTGGRAAEDPNCAGWTLNDFSKGNPGTTGSEEITGPAWLPANNPDCNFQTAILCLCW